MGDAANGGAPFNAAHGLLIYFIDRHKQIFTKSQLAKVSPAWKVLLGFVLAVFWFISKVTAVQPGEVEEIEPASEAWRL
jgi:flagellar biogenesis protein FliO